MCPHSFDHGWEDGYMEMDLYRKLIDEIKGFAFRVILQVRGESLLHKDFATMARMSKDAGLQTGFHTNATRLDDKLSEKLLRIGLDFVVFSFNGESADVHNRLCQSNSYEQTLTNALTFLKIQKRLNLSRPEVVIQVLKLRGDGGESGRFKISQDFKDMFKGLPVHSITSVWIANRGPNSKEKCALRIQNPSYGYMSCRCPWAIAVVAWNGNVIPCHNAFNEEYVMGNIYDEPLLKIWNGRKMIALREALSKGNYTQIDLCRTCEELWSLEGEGSVARKVLAGIIRLSTHHRKPLSR
jgi:radical SAM protein with 4Fe4S-binding SPASM domain